jgi:hypothetical protein
MTPSSQGVISPEGCSRCAHGVRAHLGPISHYRIGTRSELGGDHPGHGAAAPRLPRSIRSRGEGARPSAQRRRIRRASSRRSRRWPLPSRALSVNPALAGFPVVAVASQISDRCLGLPGIAPALGDLGVLATANESVTDGRATSQIDTFVLELAHPAIVRLLTRQLRRHEAAPWVGNVPRTEHVLRA